MWNKIANIKPFIGVVVMTKIDHGNGATNEQRLKFDGKLWWVPDGSMYVYYTPTHWKTI